MRKRCPHCQSFSVVRLRRPLWKRLARRPHRYACIDCGASVQRDEALTVGEAWCRDALQDPRPAHSAAPGRQHAARPEEARAGAPPPSRPRPISTLLRWLGRAPIRVWVIKQIDDDILHLCGIGTPHGEQRRRAVIEALARGVYRSGIRIGQTGPVLNSRLFQALVPLEALRLEQGSAALWQGRRWRVSRVPARCWTYEGRLVAHPALLDSRAGWISSEDVSTLRDSITPCYTPPGMVEFKCGAARGDPLAYKAPCARRDNQQGAGGRPSPDHGLPAAHPDRSDPE
ncbi:hypothetical protein [Halomonas maura]|uniref:hypothetical protein n=1 Tax=Halomonas maura TaxID=117606 RepID=UPI0025B3C8E6|nr:hypothetical protein [Halomonas maura]MDN3555124.1 hypothetical protein [Halomonas maura]